MDNTEKFSGRAENYTKGRPSYAQEFIKTLYGTVGFNENSVVADIGSGTGKLSKQLLDMGSTVYCVEPNDDMRRIAQSELSSYSNFISVKANAEMTGLKGNSIDFITCAQAFHWFDAGKFKQECKRILKPAGKVVLVWNTRDMDSNFSIESYEIYKKYCPLFKGFHGGMRDDDKRIYDFFNNKCSKMIFENPLAFTREKFITRSLSASYSIKSGDEGFESYIRELEELFDKYCENGFVTVKNNTVAYAGEIL
ncbi:MAG: class I SAM-dependent methyltransferase [Eubacterium sp.]